LNPVGREWLFNAFRNASAASDEERSNPRRHVVE
jgi:hypothetical protein